VPLSKAKQRWSHRRNPLRGARNTWHDVDGPKEHQKQKQCCRESDLTFVSPGHGCIKPVSPTDQ